MEKSKNTPNISPSTLLPHEGRMLLVDEILELDAEKAVTRTVVQESWPMVDDLSTNAIVLIEVIAQTAGIHNSWILENIEGSGIKRRGWIVGIKKATMLINEVPIGTCLVTRTKNLYSFEGFMEISGSIRIEGKNNVVAQVTLQLLRDLSSE